MNKRYYHWIKLQRRYRSIQRQQVEQPSRSLIVKLDRIRRRLHRLNRSWQLGISTATLTAWLVAVPTSTVSSQVFSPTIDLSTSLNATDGFAIDGEDGSEAATTNSVEAAGDLNGDGIDDLIIGVSRASPNGLARAGATYVIFGRNATASFGANVSLSDLDGSNGFKVSGDGDGYGLGTSVSAAGDLNGDGIDDLVMGASSAGPDIRGNSGNTYVVFGKKDPFPAEILAANLNGTNGFRLTGENELDNSGRSVSTAGDINGDGVHDLVIGVPGASTMYVIFGKKSGSFDAEIPLSSIPDTNTNGFKIVGNSNERFGESINTAGDLNGDGINDFVIGAAGAAVNSVVNVGKTYVVFGKQQNDPFEEEVTISGLDGTNGFQLLGEGENNFFGRFVSAAGDVNADGIHDLIVNAPSAEHSGIARAGVTYVLFGKALNDPFEEEMTLGNLDEEDGFTILGEGPTGNFPNYSNTVTAGDINGDGIDDVLIGIEGIDPGGITNVGTTYVVFGKQPNESFGTEIALSALDGTNGFKVLGKGENAESGGSVSVQDLNADGIKDLFIGGSLGDPAVSGEAGVYVIFGRKEPLAPVLANALPDALSAQEGNAFGYEVPDGTFSDPNPVDSFTLSASLADGSPLPAWLAFDTATGTFSGTPERADAATLTVRVTATDEDGLTGNDEFVLTVNDLPLLATIADRSVNSEEPLTFTSTADNEIGTLTFSIDGPSVGKGMTINESTGDFSWTPTANDAGANEVTVSVSDGQATDETTFTITVSVPLGVSPLDHPVLIYPNPTDGVLKVDGLKGIHQVVVYSLAGVPVLAKEEVADGALDISRLQAGSYLVTFGKNGKTLLQTRVVKIN